MGEEGETGAPGEAGEVATGATGDDGAQRAEDHSLTGSTGGTDSTVPATPQVTPTDEKKPDLPDFSSITEALTRLESKFDEWLKATAKPEAPKPEIAEITDDTPVLSGEAPTLDSGETDVPATAEIPGPPFKRRRGLRFR